MTTLFISHSSKDNDWATELQQFLEANEPGRGYQALFLDIDPEGGLHPGVKWEQALYRKLRQARAVVALCSQHWLASPWCVAEGMMAREQGKPLFMLVTKGVMQSAAQTGEDAAKPQASGTRGIPEAFKEHQFISLQDCEPPAAYERLIKGLDQEGVKRRDFPLPPEPYPGVKAFSAAYAAVFCGRDQEIDRLKELLAKVIKGNAKSFVLVLGASGSGKSSLVRAGVVPAVAPSNAEGVPWEEEALRRGSEWVVPVPFTGGKGIEEMAQSLASALEQAGRPAEMCEYTLMRDGLATDVDEACHFLRDRAQELLKQTHHAPDGRVLFVLDQLEEIFGPSATEDARRLLRLLLAVCKDRRGPVAVLATMRSEYFDTFQRFQSEFFDTYQSFAEEAGCYEEFPLDPMPRNQFGTVIRGPADRFGLKFEPDGLPERLIDDTFFNDALPLLSHTLHKLYEQATEGRFLTAKAYERLFPEVQIENAEGQPEIYQGVAASIRATAEQILKDHKYHSLAPNKREWQDLRHAFFLLTQVGEVGQFTRRSAPWNSIPESSRPVLESFIDERLLSRTRETSSGDQPGAITIAVTHEALFRVWDTLRIWLETDRDALALRKQIRTAAREWKASGQKGSLLWPDERVVDAVEQMAGSGVKLRNDEDAEIIATFLGPTDPRELEALPSRTADDSNKYGEFWCLPLSHQARAKVGDRLALLDDRRRGVGLRAGGLPDIDWCEVVPRDGRETETVTIEIRLDENDPDSEVADTLSQTVSRFWIARYPVTVMQFQAFLKQCYVDGHWRLPATAPALDDAYPPPKPRAVYDNQPIDSVNWADAVSFCAWLTEALGFEVRLPTEFEWQLAASGGDPHRKYPFSGVEWNLQDEPWRANTAESELGRSTAVGLYPRGVAPCGALDMGGTINEWCLNSFDEPTNQAWPNDWRKDRRALRGGSWNGNESWARCASRYGFSSSSRDGPIGFRLLCVSPILDH